jgi:hypothetical protein
MRVRELVRQLMNADQDAEVFLLTRSGWPRPAEVYETTTRADLIDHYEMNPDATKPDLSVVELFDGPEGDVFLMEEARR